MRDLFDLPRTEDWRWSDRQAMAAAARLPASAPARRDHFLDLPGDRLVIVDGRPDLAASTLKRTTFATVGPSVHPLAARATGEGWSLRLDRDASADPLQIVHVTTGGENHLPGEIVLAEDATAHVIETFTGQGWANRLTRMTLGRAARLMRSVRLLQSAGFTSLRDEVDVGEGASLVTVVLGAGDAGARIDGQVDLTGEAAFAEMGGALLARGAQSKECAVVVNHAEPSGQSRQIWRAVAADRATASLAARVEVARHAQKTDGEQSLRGLLLQRTATVNLKPELEIYADDVKCAHGATVGELDARALFYLQSRGIPEPRAKALLTRAFVADALDRIGDETVREAFMTDADRWLEAAL